MPTSPETCPVCGTDVPKGRLACPECGADELSGWNEENTIYDGMDLPDESFDHDTFSAREFGGNLRPQGLSLGTWVLAILVLIGVVALFVF